MSMTMHHRERQAARGQSRADRIEYRLLVAIAFVICFVMAGASRLVAAMRGKPLESHGRLFLRKRGLRPTPPRVTRFIA
jgi:hypothetical protein